MADLSDYLDALKEYIKRKKRKKWTPSELSDSTRNNWTDIPGSDTAFFSMPEYLEALGRQQHESKNARPLDQQRMINELSPKARQAYESQDLDRNLTNYLKNDAAAIKKRRKKYGERMTQPGQWWEPAPIHPAKLGGEKL